MTDALNQTTTYEYDKQGWQIATIAALGRRTVSVYNDKGGLVEMIAPDSPPTNSSNNPRMRMVYDAAGREIAEIGAPVAFRSKPTLVDFDQTINKV